MSYSTLLGQVLWAVGSGLTVLLAAVVVFRLLSGGREAQLAVPAWLIPGVAALDIAVTGAHMPMAWAHELNLFAIAMGSTLAVVLFNRIFARLIHEPAMAKGMTPSLMVMVAPFAVGFLAYVNVFGAVDRFASVLFLLWPVPVCSVGVQSVSKRSAFLASVVVDQFSHCGIEQCRVEVR